MTINPTDPESVVSDSQSSSAEEAAHPSSDGSALKAPTGSVAIGVGSPESAETQEAIATFQELQEGDASDRSTILAEGVITFSRWCLRLLIIGVTVYAGWRILGALWQGVLPVALALLVSSVLWPPVSWLKQHRVPGWCAALLTMVLLIGSFSVIIALIAPGVVRQSQTLYFQAIDGIQRLQLWLQGPPLSLKNEDFNRFFGEAVGWIQQQAGNIAGGVFAGLGAASSALVLAMITLVITFFVLKDGERFMPWARAFTGRQVGWHLTELLARCWNTLSNYIRVQALVALIDAVLTGLGLVVMKVPMALALATLTFVAGFVPIVGAFVAGTVAVAIALVTLGITKALMVLVLILVVQQVEGNILSPMLQSKAMNLHPAVVIIVVTVGGGMFGIAGALLAVPITAIVAVVLRYLSDMVALRAGEKTAAEIEFATMAGSITGMQGEEAARRRSTARATTDDPDSLLSKAQEATSHLAHLFHKKDS